MKKSSDSKIENKAMWNMYCYYFNKKENCEKFYIIKKEHIFLKVQYIRAMYETDWTNSEEVGLSESDYRRTDFRQQSRKATNKIFQSASVS